MASALSFGLVVQFLSSAIHTRVELPKTYYWTLPTTVSKLTSCRPSLSFDEWRLIHRSRLGILPLLGALGITSPDRRGKADIETTSHVTSKCQVNLPASGRRHEEVLEALVDTIQKVGNETRVHQVFPDPFLRPDIVVSSTTPPNIIDVTIPFDAFRSFRRLRPKD